MSLVISAILWPASFVYLIFTISKSYSEWLKFKESAAKQVVDDRFDKIEKELISIRNGLNWKK